MTRSGTDKIDDKGITSDGYDYTVQCWIINYIVQSGVYEGYDIREIQNHSIRCNLCGGLQHTGRC